MRQRRLVLLLGALLLSGCGPSSRQIAGAVLVFAPIVYLVAMWVVSALYGMWQSVLPGLRFGRNSHIAALAGLIAMACYGARYADADLFGLVLLFFGTCVLGWWLLLARLTVRSGWGFRWGGLVVCGLLTAPMLLALLLPEHAAALADNAVAIYLFTGALGGVPLVFLITMLIEAARVVRAVREVEVAGVTPDADP